MGGGTPDMFADAAGKVRPAFQEAGRRRSRGPWRSATSPSAPTLKDAARTSLGDYYSFLGDIAEQIIGGAVTDPDTARGYRDAFAAAGAHELIFFPSSPDPAQVDLLAEALR